MKTKKRPCRICRKWFMPNPRLERQRTCGRSECKQQWRVKKCAEWNKKNVEYFKSNYLHKKLTAVLEHHQNSKDPSAIKSNSDPPKPQLDLKLPRKYVQEVIGVQLLVIIEYINQLLIRRVKEVIRG